MTLTADILVLELSLPKADAKGVQNRNADVEDIVIESQEVKASG